MDACDRWPHERNLPTVGRDVCIQRMRLWSVQEGPLASGLSFVQSQHSQLCQPGCFKWNKVEKSTVSLSYIIHQVAITAADRTVYPTRPCVLSTSRGQRDFVAWLNPLSSLSHWTFMCAQWAVGMRLLTKRSELMIDEWVSGGLWLEWDKWRRRKRTWTGERKAQVRPRWAGCSCDAVYLTWL